ncbi:PREDICTED: two-component response regulator-like PRR95 [Camelina sativa]|uniref:Two-component response regulator-like PRR95 n=1 Tax=Camelina sativa TaxID=90675 RepID=A0ABM0SZK1_CAMSA|nr:PREDICTED: two-component response regulator-like PRR95 [Camelina sativa]
MDSDLYIFDGSSSSSSICHSTDPDMFSSDTTTTTTTDLFCNNPYLNPLMDDHQSLNFFDNFTPTSHHHLLSSSPPISQLQTLTLSHTNSFPNFSGFESFDTVKTEQLLFNSPFDAPFMEDSSTFQNQNLLNSPEDSYFSGHMRRVYSTGDLQNMRRDFTGQRSYSSPLAVESSSTTQFTGEDQSLKVGRYSSEERKEKISKYRAKRTQRNFTKTIKYACRKTLADNRPRVRGRFARNDEVFENPKIASSFTRQENNDDDLWNLDGLHEEEEACVSLVECQPQLQMQYMTNSFW